MAPYNEDSPDLPLAQSQLGGAGRLALGTPSAPRRLLLALLFTDIVGSTRVSERLGDDSWFGLLHTYRAEVRAHLAQFGGREVDTCGDGFFAVFARPAIAIQCAGHIRTALVGSGIEIRAGVHSGECCVDDGKVAGIAVHVAARIVALAHPMEVLVSETVKDLVAGSGLAFVDRGSHALRGLSHRRKLFAYGSDAVAPPAPDRVAWPGNVKVMARPSRPGAASVAADSSRRVALQRALGES